VNPSRAGNLDIRASGEGAVFRVVVRPAGRRDRLVALFNGAVKVEVRNPPVRGKANEGLRRLLSGILKVDRSDVEILKGAGRRQKVVRVRGAAPGGVRSALAAALSTPGGDETGPA
jgi:uncharacterized protein (TIGR00251 family)